MTITQDLSSPLIVVVSATGAQGRSVIDALSTSDRTYRIRGLTRDTNKPAAQALLKKGIEVVPFDAAQNGADIVKGYFEGADVAFVNTLSTTKKQELTEAKLYLNAVKEAHVRLVVWSGLESLSLASNGKFTNVDVFESKADILRYATEDLKLPIVNVSAGLYMSNFSTFGKPVKQPDGTYAWFRPAKPESVIPLLDTEHDYGLFVRKAIEFPDERREVLTYGELISYEDMAKQLSDIAGKTVKFVQVTPEEFTAGVGGQAPGGETWNAMYQAITEVGYYGAKDLSESHDKLARKPRTWADFVKATDWSHILN